jgi:hypothetical protein
VATGDSAPAAAPAEDREHAGDTAATIITARRTPKAFFIRVAQGFSPAIPQP